MLVITNEHREILSYLRDLSPEELTELCTNAVECTFLKQNSENAVASSKFNITIQQISMKDVFEALICLLIGPLKYNVSNAEFSEGVNSIGFSENQTASLWKHSQTKNSFLSQIVYQYKIQQYHFGFMEWRLEAKICSRSFYNHVSPNIIIKLHLHSGKVPENREIVNSVTEYGQMQVLMQTDLTTLRHIIEILEQALIVSKSSKLHFKT